MAPATMKAVKVIEQGKAQVCQVPLPVLRDDYILVKIVAVALNPTDWKHIDYLATPGATVGCDYAGIVEEVGSKVTKTFKKGDRISGFAHGVNATNTEDGCFAEYAVVKGDVQMKMPDSMTIEDAATLGVGVSTVGQGLYQSLKLPLPNQPAKEPFPLLIYGASTATGTLAIQYAKLSNLTVLAVCSPHNFDLVKGLGADMVFDYKDPQCAEKIRAATNDRLQHAFDCISAGTSPALCGDALSSNGGTVSFLLNVTCPRKDVVSKTTLAYTIVNEPIKMGETTIPAQPENFAFGRTFWEMAQTLFAEGKIKAHPVDARPGGIEGILAGLNDLRTNKVSGKKIVYVL